MEDFLDNRRRASCLCYSGEINLSPPEDTIVLRFIELQNYSFLEIFSNCVFIYFVCICGGHRTTFRGLFSFSTGWVLRGLDLGCQPPREEPSCRPV